jgi:hypothetical protein
MGSQQALAGYEKALGPDHTSTLTTVQNLGNLYTGQGKLGEAEQMYQRALAGSELLLSGTLILNTQSSSAAFVFISLPPSSSLSSFRPSSTVPPGVHNPSLFSFSHPLSSVRNVNLSRRLA